MFQPPEGYARVARRRQSEIPRERGETVLRLGSRRRTLRRVVGWLGANGGR